MTRHTRLALGWSVALALAVGALFVSRISEKGRYHTRAHFPAETKPATLAIRDPLIRPELLVQANFQASDLRQTSVWMMVDSGATGVTTPSDTYAALGLDPLPHVDIRSEDPRGRVIVWPAGLVPSLHLGGLEVTDVVTAVGGPTPILGQSVLAHAPWEVDWDAGTLTLGASSWPAGKANAVLPMRSLGDADVVSIEIDGVSVDMIVDTGAFSSAIPSDVGRQKGLTERRIPPTVLHSTGGDVTVRSIFSGRMSLGGLPIGNVELATFPTQGKRASLGLLGLDVLSRFSMLVSPAQSLSLALRGDVRASAARRLARWPFLSTSCPHAGCLTATLAKGERDAELTMRFESELRMPVEVLLGCAGEAGPATVRTRTSLGWIASPETPRHLRVRLPDGFSAGSKAITIEAGARWFSDGAEACQELVALDISPIHVVPSAPGAPTSAHDDAESGGLTAMLWP